MSRKRKSDPSSTEVNPEQPQAGAGVAELPPGEPSVDEAKAGGPSFADKVGQKKPVPLPDPFGIATDNLAGVRLFEDRQESQMAIKFGDGSPEAKPSQAVIDKMHEAGWKWKRADRVWAFPVMPHSAMSTRIAAEQLYQDVRQMIRQEKGIEPTTPDIAF